MLASQRAHIGDHLRGLRLRLDELRELLLAGLLLREDEEDEERLLSEGLLRLGLRLSRAERRGGEAAAALGCMHA